MNIINNNTNNETSIKNILNTLEKKNKNKNNNNNNNIINRNNSSENAEEFLLNLFKLQNQIKLFHLQTLSYAQHRATDKFVEKISDITDKVLEAYQGLYGRIYLKKQKNINIYNMNDKQVIDFLKKMRQYFKDISPKLFNKKDTELFNLMDEISETIDNILYLFTLE